MLRQAVRVGGVQLAGNVAVMLETVAAGRAHCSGLRQSPDRTWHPARAVTAGIRRRGAAGRRPGRAGAARQPWASALDTYIAKFGN